MSDLAKVQRDFRQFILGHDSENFLSHVKSSDHSKETLLNVYHNNVFSVHHRSLKMNYPLVFLILGDAFAKPMVQAYVETCLPCTGSLSDWGGGFASFIQRYEPAGKWPFLSEVAQFERAKNIAYLASEDPLFTPDDMRLLLEFAQKGVTFHFQKSCQLLAFLNPLEHIVAHYENNQQPLEKEWQGSSYGLIVKHQGIVKVYWLTPSLFAFINRLKEGQDAEVAFAAAQVLEPQFDAQEAFCFLLQNPILHR